MKTFLFIYIVGFALCGIIHMLLLRCNFFHDFYIEKINEAGEELDEEAKHLLGDLNYESIITLDVFVTSLFSWLGLIYVLIMFIVVYISKKINL